MIAEIKRVKRSIDLAVRLFECGDWWQASEKLAQAAQTLQSASDELKEHSMERGRLNVTAFLEVARQRNSIPAPSPTRDVR